MSDRLFISTVSPFNRGFFDEAVRRYCQHDVEVTEQVYKTFMNRIYGARPSYIPAIEKVIFNDPATIVIWKDGTKTVVKCCDWDEFDPEKGLAMAIAKKALGNKGNYFNEIKKWTKPWYEEQERLAEEDYSSDSFCELIKTVSKIRKKYMED